MTGAGETNTICRLADLTEYPNLSISCDGYIDLCDAYRNGFAFERVGVVLALPRADGGSVHISSYNECVQAAHDLPLAFGSIDRSALEQTMRRFQNRATESPPPVLALPPPPAVAPQAESKPAVKSAATTPDSCTEGVCHGKDFRPSIGKELQRTIHFMVDVEGTLKGTSITVAYSCVRNETQEHHYTLTYRIEDTDERSLGEGTVTLTKTDGRWDPVPRLELHLQTSGNFTKGLSARITGTAPTASESAVPTESREFF